MNILTSEFYENLIVVVYNGPPRTLYGKYNGHTHTEDGICKAIEECQGIRPSYIINPSNKVMMSFIKHFSFYFEAFKNPPKEVIKFAVIQHYPYFEKHQDQFDEAEIIDMLVKKEIPPVIIKYIKDPSLTLCIVACQLNGFVLKYIKQQTLELCKIAVKEISTGEHYNSDDDFIKYITCFDDDIADMAITKSIIKGFKYIPPEYITKERIHKALYIDPYIIVDIPEQFMTQELWTDAFTKKNDVFEKIPTKYITDDMTRHIMNNKIYKLYKYIPTIDDMCFIDMFKEHVTNIKFIPHDIQTLEMCVTAVRYNMLLLQYCRYMNDDMLTEISKSMEYSKTNKKNIVPKKDRFTFINGFNEDVLIKLVKIRPSLIRNLSKNNLTDTIIREALAQNGYLLQYIEDKKPEYIEIALKNQPNAIKYEH
jgi:hypothetical protein